VEVVVNTIEGVVEASFSGMFNYDEITAFCSDLITKHGCESVKGYVLNFSGLLSAMAVFDAYFIASAIAGTDIKSKRIAVLRKRELADSEKFFITTGMNKGLILKEFTSREEAINWAAGRAQ
jgi:hypothetical protein